MCDDIEVLYPPERGGPLKRPWESPEEVPETLWRNHRTYNRNMSDEKYLAYLNYLYYGSYQVAKEEKKVEARKTPCGAPGCTVMVDPRQEGPNLCGSHMRILKKEGTLGCFRYTGESHA
ncbi:MAG: hypothetical protein ACWGQW_05315 [bacterium]